MLTPWLNRIFRFSKISITEGIKSDVAGLENISKMPFYQSFKQGLNLTLNRQLDQANKHFQQALNLLQQRKQHLNDHYLHIYRKYHSNKIVANQIELRQYQAAEQNLYKLIKMKKKSNFQSIMLYDDYNTLFQFFLRYNVQKAILLGKALLTEREVEAMSLKHKKVFVFNLANAYFLVGNYADAKAKYSDCLSQDPHPELKAKVYNNLGLACWWHKNPLLESQPIQTLHSRQQIDSDYTQSRQLFLKAIQTAQTPQQLSSQQQKYKLKQAISQYELDITAKFGRREAIQPIYNLVQYYINNEPNEKIKIMYWLRILLQLAQNTNSQTYYDEIFATLCLLSNDKNTLLSFLPMAVQKYKGKSQQIYYTKLLSFFASNAAQHNQHLQHATQLELQFQKQDKYMFKRKYLNLYDLVL